MMKIMALASIVALATSQTCYEQAPFDCPEGTFCTRWSDGCNTCGCGDPDAALPLCTVRFCSCYEDDSCVSSCVDNEGCKPFALGREQGNSTHSDGSHNSSTAESSGITSPPANGTNSSSPSGENMLRALYQFGFYEGAFPPSVTEASLAPDIPGLVCQMQAFYSELLQTTTGASSLYTQLTEIEWELLPSNGSYPVVVIFTVEFYDEMDAGQAELSSFYASPMRQALQGLDLPDQQTLITQWVWESEPVGRNLFASTNSVAFYYNWIQEPEKGRLDRVDCGDGIRT